ncbi:MAG: hypothetical protein Q9195_005964 [Heterodermia aff. obscurata]
MPAPSAMLWDCVGWGFGVAVEVEDLIGGRVVVGEVWALDESVDSDGDDEAGERIETGCGDDEVVEEVEDSEDAEDIEDVDDPGVDTTPDDVETALTAVMVEKGKDPKVVVASDEQHPAIVRFSTSHIALVELTDAAAAIVYQGLNVVSAWIEGFISFDGRPRFSWTY